VPGWLAVASAMQPVVGLRIDPDVSPSHRGNLFSGSSGPRALFVHHISLVHVFSSSFHVICVCEIAYI
jgi:hypothetical protein